MPFFQNAGQRCLYTAQFGKLVMSEPVENGTAVHDDAISSGIVPSEEDHIRVKLDHVMRKRPKLVVQVLDDCFEKGKGYSMA